MCLNSKTVKMKNFTALLMILTGAILITCTDDPVKNDCVQIDSEICEQTVPTDEICAAYFQRWFYNKKSSSCKRISYSGCSQFGFETKIECEACKCNQKMLDFEHFTIEVPTTWTPIELQGIDSYVGQIKISNQENVTFDFGWYSNPLDVDIATHDINIILIDNKKAKIVKPKNFGQGTTGVYFDSLEVSKINKFQISGTNLSAQNQKRFLRAIETLTFKN